MKVRYLVLMLAVMPLLFACSKSPAPGQSSDEKSTKTTGSVKSLKIKWHNNLQEALAEAKRSGMPVMADFYADWCGWCKKLDKEVYVNPEVAVLAEKFVSAKINADIDRENSAKYNITGLPTIVFLDPDGELVHTIVGYMDAADFVETMSEVLKQYAK
jgi:thiol:disulfide interchange protein